MALAGFFGAAAQSTDDSMREWRRLFQVDQQLKQQREFAEKELNFKERDFDWRRDMADIQNALAADNFAMDRLEAFYEKAMGNWDNLDTNERFALMSELDAMDFSSAGPMVAQFADSYTGVMEANLRDTMTAQQAREYFANILQSPYGTHVPEFLLTEGLRALQGHEDYDEIEALMTEHAATSKEDHEAFMANERVRDFASANQATADVEETEARTGLLGYQSTYTQTQIDKMVQDMGFEADKHPLIVRNMDLVNQALDLEIEAGQISNEYLGPRLAAELGNLLAETRELDNANEIHEAIFDSMVDRYVAETDMTRSEARVMLASETARIATANLEPERVQAGIDQVRASIRVLDSELDVNASVVDNNRMANTEARVRIAQDLIATGNPELISATGRELLLPVVGEENVDELLAGLTEIASSTRERDDALADANMLIAVTEGRYLERTLEDRVANAASAARAAGANADEAEWRAAHADEILEFEQGLQERGMVVNEGQLSVAERQAAVAEGRLVLERDALNAEMAYRMSTPVPGTAGLVGEAWTDAVRAVNSAAGTTPEDIRTHWDSYENLNRNYTSVLGLGDASNPNFNVDAAKAMLEQHGYDTSMMVTPEQVAGSLSVLQEDLAARAEIARTRAIGSARAYINIAKGAGFLPTQEQLGWRSGLYDAAFGLVSVEPGPSSSTGGFMFEAPPTEYDVPELEPSDERLISIVVRGAVDSYYDPEQGGINMVQAKDMWENPDILTEDAREALVNVGIDSAYKFMQYLNQEGEDKMRMLAVEDTANRYFTAAGNPPIDSKNSESRHAFQAFATNIMTNAPTALSVLDSVNPMGLTEEEWNNRNEWMGLQEGPTFIGVDTAVNRITETLGIPAQLLYESGAIEETRNGLQINDRVMRMFIRDISAQMSDAYEVVDTLAQW